MLKTVSLTLVGVFTATAIFAGEVAFTPQTAPAMIDDAAPMGSSGGWIIPLIAILAIGTAIALTDNERGLEAEF